MLRVTLAVAISVALVVGAGFGIYALAHRDCTFDRDRWRAGARLPEHSPERYEALRDQVDVIVQCRTLEGLRRSEINALLGKGLRRERGDAPGYWFFDVGLPEGLSDYPALEIHFDDQGRASDIRVPDYAEP